jgi:hypothetical protein
MRPTQQERGPSQPRVQRQVSARLAGTGLRDVRFLMRTLAAPEGAPERRGGHRTGARRAEAEPHLDRASLGKQARAATYLSQHSKSKSNRQDDGL